MVMRLGSRHSFVDELVRRSTTEKRLSSWRRALNRLSRQLRQLNRLSRQMRQMLLRRLFCLPRLRLLGRIECFRWVFVTGHGVSLHHGQCGEAPEASVGAESTQSIWHQEQRVGISKFQTRCHPGQFPPLAVAPVGGSNGKTMTCAVHDRAHRAHLRPRSRQPRHGAGVGVTVAEVSLTKSLGTEAINPRHE